MPVNQALKIDQNSSYCWDKLQKKEGRNKKCVYFWHTSFGSENLSFRCVNTTCKKKKNVTFYGPKII
jgi:hypothetical protein